ISNAIALITDYIDIPVGYKDLICKGIMAAICYLLQYIIFPINRYLFACSIYSPADYMNVIVINKYIVSNYGFRRSMPRQSVRLSIFPIHRFHSRGAPSSCYVNISIARKYRIPLVTVIYDGFLIIIPVVSFISIFITAPNYMNTTLVYRN